MSKSVNRLAHAAVGLFHHRPPSLLSNYFIAINNSPAYSASSGTLGNLIALQNTAYNLSTGTVAGIRGLANSVVNTAGGVMSQAFAIQNIVNNVANGSVTVAAAELMQFYNSGTGNINYLYGLNVGNPINSGGGTISNFYGVYVEAPTTPVNKWPLYVVGGNSYFGGNVGIGTTAPSRKLHVEGGSGTAVYGVTNGGGATSFGVYGETTANGGYGVYGHANTAGQAGYGLYGQATGTNGYAIFGNIPNGSSGYAGYFNGAVNVNGTLSKASGSFKIDHPLDPANKYLYHSFVESPDMMNIYNGNVITDQLGVAIVTLPDYFETLNREFRYQLTVIGKFAQAIVSEEISGNQFYIQTNQPYTKVSWQVTGVRQDAYAEAHRIPTEELKPATERGSYLHPEVHGQPEEKGVEWLRNPAMMKQLKKQREKSEKEKRAN